MNRSLKEYWKGSKAYVLIENAEISGKEIFTTLAEANERASICINCPFNQPLTGKIAKVADAVILRKVDGRKTLHDRELKNCGACSCPLRLAVHLSDEILRHTKSKVDFDRGVKKRTAETKQKINPACWQAKIL